MSRSLLLTLFVAVPLLLLWGAVLIDLVTRSDLSIPARVAWAVATFVTQHVGVLAYLAVRPLRYPETRTALDPATEELLEAAASHERGLLDDQDLQSVKTRMLTTIDS